MEHLSVAKPWHVAAWTPTFGGFLWLWTLAFALLVVSIFTNAWSSILCAGASSGVRSGEQPELGDGCLKRLQHEILACLFFVERKSRSCMLVGRNRRAMKVAGKNINKSIGQSCSHALRRSRHIVYTQNENTTNCGRHDLWRQQIVAVANALAKVLPRPNLIRAICFQRRLPNMPWTRQPSPKPSNKEFVWPINPVEMQRHNCTIFGLVSKEQLRLQPLHSTCSKFRAIAKTSQKHVGVQQLFVDTSKNNVTVSAVKHFCHKKKRFAWTARETYCKWNLQHGY